MSQSRADRRRNARAGTTPPGKRDPMVPIYIGLAVVVVLIFIGFGATNLYSNHQRDEVAAFEKSTPTPGPQPTQKPIQLKDLQPIGVPTIIPVPNLQKGIMADTRSGGRGQPVDNIPCESMEQAVMHVHTHLTIVYRGRLVQVPAFIGISPTATGGCLYWLHTHGPDGIIHIEAGQVDAPDGGPYTLGMFFDIWGQPLDKNQVGPYVGPLTMFVNRIPYNGDPRSIPLRSHQMITLEVGSPVIPPPNFKLPPLD